MSLGVQAVCRSSIGEESYLCLTCKIIDFFPFKTVIDLVGYLYTYCISFLLQAKMLFLCDETDLRHNSQAPFNGWRALLNFITIHENMSFYGMQQSKCVTYVD